jgi:hypothetical protein
MTALACFLFSAIGLVPALSAAEVPDAFGAGLAEI